MGRAIPGVSFGDGINEKIRKSSKEADMMVDQQLKWQWAGQRSREPLDNVVVDI